MPKVQDFGPKGSWALRPIDIGIKVTLYMNHKIHKLNHVEVPLNTVILRNIPNDIMNFFRQRAHRQKTSLNKAVLGLLQEAFGTSVLRKKKGYHDLDQWLAKAHWSKEEADQFDDHLREQRHVDPKDWL